MIKSIIKMLGISIGCSCTAVQAQTDQRNELRETDALILTTISQPDPELLLTRSGLSSLQDIDKIYAL